MARDQVRVVVLSGHTMALGAVRALGEAGVPVEVLHHDDRDMAHVSRHVRAQARVPPPLEDEAGFVEAVLRHGERLGGAMLLPASDEAIAATARHRAALAATYLVACPPWELARNFLEKARTYALAAAAGVGTPRTLAPASVAEARDFARRIGLPLLVKPSQSHLYFERFRRKMTRVGDPQALGARVGEALDAGLEVMLQELIPGPDTEVVNYNAYAREGLGLVEFTARQLRKAPPRLGSPRVVVSERLPALLEPGRSTLRALGIDGFACCEFKRDPRDGTYKILDVNGRPNLSGLLAVRCGINFPLLQYRHLVHGEVPAAAGFREGVHWTDFYRDAGYGVLHLLEEHHAPWAYAAPYLAPHCDATFDLRDPAPFLLRGWKLAGEALAALLPGRGNPSPAGRNPSSHSPR
jgi:predicted ATP-grasp superfamily ATP-dependent carboligase